MSLSSLIGSAVSAVTGTSPSTTNGVMNAIGQAQHGNVAGAVSSLVSALAGGKSSALRSPGSPSNPTNKLAGALARSDPALSYQWYCIMPALTGLPASSKVYNLPWYMVEEATVPRKTFQTRTVFREGRDKKYVSKYSLEPLRLGIYKDTTNTAFSYLYAWQNAGVLQTPTTVQNISQKAGQFGYAAKYKRQIIVYFTDATYKMLHSFVFTGCWPTNIDALSMDSGSSTRLMEHVSFEVDDLFHEVFSVSSSSSNILASKNSVAISKLLSSVPGVGSSLGAATSLVNGAVKAAGSLF